LFDSSKEAGEKTGRFLPGDLSQKIDPYHALFTMLCMKLLAVFDW